MSTPPAPVPAPDPFPFGDRLPRLAEALAADYARHRQTCRPDAPPLPEEAVVRQVIGLSFQLLYPGFFGGRADADPDASVAAPCETAARLMAELAPLLRDQIAAALRHAAPGEAAAAESRAAEMTLDLLAALPEIRSVLADDVQAAFDGDPAARDTAEAVLCYPGVCAVTVHRLAHRLHRMGVPLVPRMMTEIAHSSTGIDIHPGAAIGRSFFIDHGTGVVIGETCVIGDRCKLYQGVTLGALSFPKDERGLLVRGTKRHPTLEDDVTIYANATVLGGDTVIGRGAVIGGNVFVTSSVPPHTLVKAGHEAKLSSRPAPPPAVVLTAAPASRP
jgi:serine O-acetyltransferase